MSKFLDYNPNNGSWMEGSYNSDGTLTVKKLNDVEPLLNHAKELRNSGTYDSAKGDMYFSKYAMIPPSVIVELHKKGIQLGNPYHTKRLLKEINENYPNLKTTNMVHNLKSDHG